MISALTRFLFPSFCLYCRHEETKGTLLCALCLENSPLLEAKGRCKRCFTLQETPTCLHCRKQPSFFYRQAFCFPDLSPMVALERDVSRFSKTIAAFLLLQWHRLHFPWPHHIFTEKSFSEVQKEFKKFLPPRKEGGIHTVSLYLSRDAQPPEDLTPFLGRQPFHLALYGEE